MKRLVIGFSFLLPLAVMAHEPPAYGLSDSVVTQPPEPEARRHLENQASSGAPDQSELSVQLHVDSQRRIAETFRRPIPEKISETSRDD